jgi:hypothetical protein
VVRELVLLNLGEEFVAQHIVYSRLASASMTRKCSRRVKSIKDVKLKQLTLCNEPFCPWAYVSITSFTWGVGNVKRWSERTYSGIKISTDDHQQLRLEVL